MKKKDLLVSAEYLSLIQRQDEKLKVTKIERWGRRRSVKTTMKLLRKCLENVEARVE